MKYIALYTGIIAISGLCMLGCSGGSSGGGGGAPPVNSGGSPAFSPLGVTGPTRLDVRTGASAPSVSMQDQNFHAYTFVAVPGHDYQISVDTSPSGQPVAIQLSLSDGSSVAQIVSQIVTTPWATSSNPTSDGQVHSLVIFDPNQNNLTLSRVTAVTPTPFTNTSNFDVLLHVAGDQFAGYPNHNALASSSDRSAFAQDLLNRVNSLLGSSGAPTVNTFGVSTLSNSQVSGLHPSLIRNHPLTNDPVTWLDSSENVDSRLWGDFGALSSDPNFGNALDIVIVHSTLDPAGGSVLRDRAETANIFLARGQGGVFTGAGREHSIVISLFDPTGAARNMDELAHTLAHGIGHFLGVPHICETNFTPDDFADTPIPSDPNNDGTWDQTEAGSGLGSNFLMKPYLDTGASSISGDQAAAMRAYLAVRQH